jgi:hypothetical protein
MSNNNKFKAGDKVTVVACDSISAYVLRDTTEGKVYTVTHVGMDNPDRYTHQDAVAFLDDAGDHVTVSYVHVQLAQ